MPKDAPARGARKQPPTTPPPLRKVVRRASLSDRTNLYRKEYEGEAILWQQRSASEDQRNSTFNGDIRETRTDQENKDPVRTCLPPCPTDHCRGRGRVGTPAWHCFFISGPLEGGQLAIAFKPGGSCLMGVPTVVFEASVGCVCVRAE